MFLLSQKHGGCVPGLISDMEVHLCHIYNPVDSPLVPTTAIHSAPCPAHRCNAVHPCEVKGYHGDNGEPEKEDIASLPRLEERRKSFIINTMFYSHV